MAKVNVPAVVAEKMQFPALPEDIAGYLGAEANITPPVNVPTLSGGGSRWTVTLDGNSKVMEQPNAEGDKVPVQIFRAVILDYAKQRGRSFYEGAYDPNSSRQPTCWSHDTIKPEANVEKKQHPTCQGCPRAAKNSASGDDGRGTIACRPYRMAALVPSARLDFPALRLKISQTSDFDGRSPEAQAAGWFGFQQFLQALYGRMGEQTHTVRAVVKMRFDTAVQFAGKIQFGFDRATTVEEVTQLVQRLKAEKDEIKQLISGEWTPAGANGVKQEEDDEGEAPLPTQAGPKPAGPKPAGPKPAAAPPPPPPAQDEEENAPFDVAGLVGEEETAAPTPPPTTAKAAGGKGKANGAAKPTTTASATPAAPAADSDEALNALLGDWK